MGKLTGFGTQFDQVSLQLDRKPAAWGLQLDSQQAKGTVNLPDAKGAPIAVNLKYVKLPAADPTAQADENAPDPLADIDPRYSGPGYCRRPIVPGLDLIGAWSLRIRPTAKGLAFNNLDLGLKGMLLKGAGAGKVRQAPAAVGTRAASTAVTLPTCSKGGVFAPTVTSEDFHLDVDGRWPGSPAWVGPSAFPAAWMLRSVKVSSSKWSGRGPGIARVWPA